MKNVNTIANANAKTNDELLQECFDQIRAIRSNPSSYTNVKRWSLLDRFKAASNGEFLEQLVNDYDPMIRAAVARQGYGLNTLIEDTDPQVRCAVANQGYGLGTLIKDPDSQVRATVARQGYGLADLINDEDDLVRLAVAEQGYGFDKLINDDSYLVRRVADRSWFKGQQLLKRKHDDGQQIWYVVPFEHYFECCLNICNVMSTRIRRVNDLGHGAYTLETEYLGFVAAFFPERELYMTEEQYDVFYRRLSGEDVCISYSLKEELLFPKIPKDWNKKNWEIRDAILNVLFQEGAKEVVTVKNINTYINVYKQYVENGIFAEKAIEMAFIRPFYTVGIYLDEDDISLISKRIRPLLTTT